MFDVLAEISCELGFMLILFLLIKLVMLLLFYVIFVVVVLLVTRVTFWCLERGWLCVIGVEPCGMVVMMMLSWLC